MKIFPIDPTPFIIPYAVIFFLLPFLIYAYHSIAEISLVVKKSDQKYKFVIPFVSLLETMKIRRNDEEVGKKFKKAIKWLIICTITWLVGFFLLAAILIIMNSNDLLIDHSRGLYGPNEVKTESDDKP